MAVPVLNGVDLQVAVAECAVLCGPSGSGKTTLLSIVGCLLTPTAGGLWIAGEDVTKVPASAMTRLRREKIGFVFQHSQLLPFLTVRENLAVVVALLIQHAREEGARLLVVTHDMRLLPMFDRVWSMERGELKNETSFPEAANEE